MNKKVIIIIAILLVIIISLLLIKNNTYSKNSANYAKQEASTSYDDGITLIENEVEIANVNYSSVSGSALPTNGTLFNETIPEYETLKIGKHYEEKLKVKNSGTKPIYVRVIINKSWVGDNDGYDSKLIELNLLENNWIIDDSLSTDSKIFLYYTKSVISGGTTSEFTDVFSINSKVQNDIIFSEENINNGKSITPIRRYDGADFLVDVTVDAVGIDNVQYDIKSNWGVDVNIDASGTLSLK